MWCSVSGYDLFAKKTNIGEISVNLKVSKSQFDTLECTLEELAILELISKY